MIGELVKIAGQCDGVRCDMAMLALPDVFERTWNVHAQPFWPDATRRVREQVPGFAFMAEVYDEPRAAATFPADVHQVAAVLTFLTPGLRFFHQGQFEGRRKRISPHLVRGPVESPD
jgi:hypothetical protein